VPVIVIGNIVAGGSGKTPIVISLANSLKHKGLKIGIVSRGYGAKIINPIIINNTHKSHQVGDEPLLIFNKTSLPICVHLNRSQAIQHLLNYKNDLDAIISDDGLQHLKMHRDIECVVFNQFEIGNSSLIPAGPLRESIRKWNYSIYSGDSIDNKIVLKSQSKAIKVNRMSTTLVNIQSHQIKNINNKSDLDEFSDKSVLIVAGIAHPQIIKQLLEKHNIQASVYNKIGDHQILEQSHIKDINTNYTEFDLIVITEKDLIKYDKDILINQIKKPVWVINLETIIPNNFIDEIYEKIVSINSK
jgi:tetraacyldisaccharide 4'-kinase